MKRRKNFYKKDKNMIQEQLLRIRKKQLRSRILIIYKLKINKIKNVIYLLINMKLIINKTKILKNHLKMKIKLHSHSFHQGHI